MRVLIGLEARVRNLVGEYRTRPRGETLVYNLHRMQEELAEHMLALTPPKKKSKPAALPLRLKDSIA